MAIKIDHPLPKKVKLIDSTLFYNSDPITELPGGIPWINYTPSKEIDLMRFRMGTSYNKQGILGLYSQFLIAGGIEKAEEIPDPSSLFFKKREKFKIRARVDDVLKQNGAPLANLTPSEIWVSFIDQDISNAGQLSHGIVPTFSKLREEDGVTAKWFQDHVCDIEVPTDKKELGDGFFGSLRVFEASIDPTYNFYIQSYEDSIEKYVPNEKILPNFYSFLTILQSRDDDPDTLDTVYEKQVNLAGALQNPGTTANHFVEKEVLNSQGEKTGITTKTSKGQYFDKYAYSLHKATETPFESELETIKNRFKNLIAPMTNMGLFTNYNDKASQFPMYFDINFSTDITTEVAEALKDSRLSSILLKDIATDNATIAKETLNFNFVPSGKNGIPFVPIPTANVAADIDTEVGEGRLEKVGPTPLTTWDMSSWFDEVVKNPVDAFNPYNEIGEFIAPLVFLGKYNEEIKAAQGESSFNFFKTLMVLIFAGKFQKMVDEKTRTFRDILGDPTTTPVTLPKQAQHETVLYKIEKWETAPGGGVVAEEGGGPIQTFYLPNSDEIDMHKFIDTQVIYGKQYTYRIYAYEMIFGTAYSYTLDSLPTDATEARDSDSVALNEAKICVFTKPSLKLVEVPYFQKQSKIIDAPPVWPDVDIIPLRGVKDKLKFFFRGNVGEYNLKPIVIQPTDEERIARVQEGQKHILGLPSGLVQYRSDDQARIFEVFRTETRPTAYKDFSNLKRAHVITDQFKTPCKMATGGAFTDTLEPNTKYYYTFRTVDNHGHFSNPSPVYEVEIVYDAGAPFLLSRVITDGYEFKKQKDPPQMPSKGVKKYIHIRPATTQTSINYQDTYVPVGPNNERKPLLDETGNPPVGLGSLKDVDFTGTAIHLGVQDEQLWGKKFKIRITSKKTGRKIDLNINFTQKHQKVVENDNTNLLCVKGG